MIFKQKNDNTWEGTDKLKGESESGTIKIICRYFLAQRKKSYWQTLLRRLVLLHVLYLERQNIVAK